MAKNFQDIMAEARKEVPEVSAQQVNELLKNNGKSPIILDVRESDEWRQGHLEGALPLPRGFLEIKVETTVPDKNAPVIAYCAGGTRSALAARTLEELGYTNVKSMAGGFSAWKRAGLPFDRPYNMTPEQSLRYARHTMLPEVGEAGQVKLLKSKVLCLGAGGLGSPAGLYLAAAGVGTLGFVDDDIVDASNLQRQILHSTDRVGLPKVESAKQAIAKLNPDVKVIGHQTRLSSENVMDIIKDYDLIVDGADNFPTRYLLNDASLKLGKPVVHGSIYCFEGQVTSFIPGKGCYRCQFPEPPPPDMAPSCQEAGVLGVLCGVIGSLQTVEAIKILLGIGKPLSDRTLFFDALGLKFREFKRHRVATCPTCGEGIKPENIELIDYQAFCNVSA